MRHWEQGLPLPAATREQGLPFPAAARREVPPPPASRVIGGRPVSLWLDLFALCHGALDGTWRRLEWPDGRPLLEQSWLQAAVFRVIADELSRIAVERTGKRGSG